jgi:hypothetical protein
MTETSYVYIDKDPEYGSMPKVHILTPEDRFAVPVYGYADVPKELADSLEQAQLAWRKAEQAIIDYAKPIFEQVRQERLAEWLKDKPARYARYLELLPKFKGHSTWDCEECHGKITELAQNRWTVCKMSDDKDVYEWDELHEEFQQPSL